MQEHKNKQYIYRTKLHIDVEDIILTSIIIMLMIVWLYHTKPYPLKSQSAPKEQEITNHKYKI